MVAGGLNVLTNSDAFAGLSNGHFLSKTPNACKTWDSEADGYCRADGVGSIVMKRLEDAEADNDNILGVVLAAATNHSADAVSITHPHAGAQSFLYREVLGRAGVDPLDVSFVEMHGTGTQAGDSVEMESITDVFAPAAPRRRTAKQPLHIGAVKSNVGHGEAAAGVTALLKTLLMLQRGAIPPHAGIKNAINPGFPKDLDRRNLNIPYEKQPWPRTPGKKRIAVVNNFSAAGGNTTLAIEEAPVREDRTRTQPDPRPSHVVAVGAKSKISLRGNLERLLAYLDDAHSDDDEVSLADLSYSTTARRYHHNYRVAVAADSLQSVRKQLQTYLDGVESHRPIPPNTHGPPLVAFAFSGQGASHKSMDLDLIRDHPAFRAQIQHLDSLARGQGFPSFVPALDGSYSKNHAHSPVVTQLALVCSQIALAQYWASLGIKPGVVIGHSLGEYAALHAAGALSASDTIFLVGQRARLLEQKCRAGSHRMMAVSASVADIEESVAKQERQQQQQQQPPTYQIACINGPKETVLADTQERIEALAETLRGDGFRCYTLDVPFAFHSEQTDPVLDDYEEIASSGVLFQQPNIPVISPLLSKVVFDSKTVNPSYLRRATREPVNFLAALNAAQKLNTVDDKTIWIEIGPHPVAVNFVRSVNVNVNVTAASLRRDEPAWTTLARSLCSLHCAGVQIDWNEFHRPFEASLRLLDLPTYSWNNKTHWIQYNGDWALTKGNTFYDAEKGGINSAAQATAPPLPPKSSLSTSTVQRIIQEEFNGSAGKVVMQSDLMQPDFLAAANGHHMNGCGVVTSVSYSLFIFNSFLFSGTYLL